MTLDSKLDRDLLANRLVKLDEEIAGKQQSRHFLAGLPRYANIRYSPLTGE